jgi:hypothetical protein
MVVEAFARLLLGRVGGAIYQTRARPRRQRPEVSNHPPTASRLQSAPARPSIIQESLA